jgi:hypothetical protein
MRKLNILMVVCCFLLLASAAQAQTGCVKVKFEIDGKEVDQKFKVVLHINNEVIKPSIIGKGFNVSADVLKNHETVGVQFLSAEYDLFFESVHRSAFETEWIVGVDKPPFDNENIDSEEPVPPGKKLLIIYYINFIPKNAEGTRLVVKVYK